MSNTRVVISVDGVGYSLDVSNLTGRESGVLKRIGKVGGVLGVPRALEEGDIEVVVALAGIAMKRAGIEPDYDKLLDLPIGMFRIDLSERPTQAGTSPAVGGTQS